MISSIYGMAEMTKSQIISGNLGLGMVEEKWELSLGKDKSGAGIVAQGAKPCL